MGLNKRREMLKYGGFRTFAQFGAHLDYYDRTKEEF